MDKTGSTEFEGFGVLYADHFADIVSVVAASCGDRWLAEVAAQEAFEKAAARWTRVRAMDNPSGWVYRVALREARRAARSRRPWQVLSAEVPNQTPPPGPFDPELVEALSRLPRRQKEALLLHYVADMSIRDVSSVMGIPANTVKSHLRRGRAALRAGLTRMVVEAP